MKWKTLIDETVQSGIKPIDLAYDSIRFFENDGKILRSLLEIESLELGHLTYKEYRFVARRTKIGDALVQRHIEKLFRAYPTVIKKKGVACITIPTYARLLKEGKLAGMLFDALTYFDGINPTHICIELSADILYEDIEEAKKRIDELREMGFKVAICEVGDEYCPVFRLAELRFDYAFVDEYVVNSLLSADAERVAGSIVKFLQYVGVKTVAPSLSGKKAVDVAKRLGFDGYSTEKASPNKWEEVAT